MNDALGIIETQGFTAGIQAADAAVKSASVKLGKWVKVGGGKGQHHLSRRRRGGEGRS